MERKQGRQTRVRVRPIEGKDLEVRKEIEGVKGRIINGVKEDTKG